MITIPTLSSFIRDGVLEDDSHYVAMELHQRSRERRYLLQRKHELLTHDHYLDL